MFPTSNGKRNSRDLAGENFALLEYSNTTEGAAGGSGGGEEGDNKRLDGIELDGSIRTGEFITLVFQSHLLDSDTVDKRPAGY